MINEYAQLCRLAAAKGWLAEPQLQILLFELAKEFEDEDARQCGMGELALSLLLIGAIEPARNALEQITLPLEKPLYLARAACVMLEHNLPQLGATFVEEAEVAANRIAAIPERAEALMEIGRTIGAQSSDKARDLLIQAEVVAGSASDPYDVSDANGILWSIARALNQLGFRSHALEAAQLIRAEPNRRAAVLEITGAS